MENNMSEFQELKKFLANKEKEINSGIKEIVEMDSPTFPSVGTLNSIVVLGLNGFG